MELAGTAWSSRLELGASLERVSWISYSAARINGGSVRYARSRAHVTQMLPEAGSHVKVECGILFTIIDMLGIKIMSALISSLLLRTARSDGIHLGLDDNAAGSLAAVQAGAMPWVWAFSKGFMP